MAYVRMPLPRRPSIRPEREFATRLGGVIVAGVDEAGRGPIAGPVVAAAVILPFEGRRPLGLNDSKKLNARDRERLFQQIQRMATAFGIGIATANEIDTVNILEATRLASLRAIDQLQPRPEALITDALELPTDPRPQLPLVKGDAISASIAAASILAKVTRDRMMDLYHEQFPKYGWDRNRGYPTEEHYAALGAHGPTVLHRLSFSGVGFFDSDLHRSPIFHRLRLRIDAERPMAASERAALDAEIAEAAGQLPPPDHAELIALLAAAATHHQSP